MPARFSAASRHGPQAVAPATPARGETSSSLPYDPGMNTAHPTA